MKLANMFVRTFGASGKPDLIWLRLVVGFLVAPLLPGVVFEVVNTIPGGGIDVLDVLLFVFWFSAKLAYPTAILLGAPLYFLFRWHGCNGLLAYLLAGALLGLLALVMFMRPGFDFFKGHVHAFAILGTLAVICGTVSTAGFWLIVRPDRAKKAGGTGDSIAF